jgi:hypothetical protein
VSGLGGLRVTVFAGALAGVRPPARVYSPLVGAELRALRDGGARVPLEPGHEHVLFAASGPAEPGGTLLAPGSLLYLEPGHGPVGVAAAEGSTLFLPGRGGRTRWYAVRPRGRPEARDPQARAPRPATAPPARAPPEGALAIPGRRRSAASRIP